MLFWKVYKISSNCCKIKSINQTKETEQYSKAKKKFEAKNQVTNNIRRKNIQLKRKQTQQILCTALNH